MKLFAALLTLVLVLFFGVCVSALGAHLLFRYPNASNPLYNTYATITGLAIIGALFVAVPHAYRHPDSLYRFPALLFRRLAALFRGKQSG